MKYTSILILLIFISAQSFAAPEVQTQIKSKKKKSPNRFKIALDVNFQNHGNLDEQVENNGVGENIKLTTIQVEANKRINLPSKVKVSSISTAEIQLNDTNQAYKDTKIIDKDNLDLNTRKLSFNQKLNLSQRINKKVRLNGIIDLETVKGHSIEQEFTPTSTNYHAIDNSHNQYSAAFGGRLKLNKNHSTQGLYRFSEFDYKSDTYTFDVKQGSNDRRIHSVGVQHKIKTQNKHNFILIAQRDQIIYKDRLSVDDLGYFRVSGLAKPSRLIDQTYKLIALSASRAYSTELATTLRTDEVGNGDGFRQNQLELAYNGNSKILAYTIKYTFGKKLYSGQIADNGIDQREDTLQKLSSELTYNFSKLQAKLKLDRVNTESNFQYGKLAYNILGIGLNTQF